MSDRTPFEFHHVLCPLVFSKLSDLALKYAAVGTQSYGAKLSVLCARKSEWTSPSWKQTTNPFWNDLREGAEKTSPRASERKKGRMIFFRIFQKMKMLPFS